MKDCRTCGDTVPYQGFGRPREYCDTCRESLDYQVGEPLCGWCGEETSRWVRYCCEDCKQQGEGEVESTPTPPPIRLATGKGPWVWEVGERYLVTVNPLYPKDAGKKESVRCGIIADFADRGTAEQFASRVRQQRWDLHKKNGIRM